jgi:DNA-directed RNA polymerase subunit L
MDIKIIKQEKNLLEVDFGDVDQSIPQLLVTKLNQDKDTEMAAYKVEHPVMSSPMLILKTKKGDALKLFTETLEALKNDVEDFKKQFVEISK